MMRTFVTYVDDQPGVLDRIASLFRRRAYNIVSVATGRCERPGVSRLTLRVDTDPDDAGRIVANLYKQVPVRYVVDLTDAPTLTVAIGLWRVKAHVDGQRPLGEVCAAVGAHIVDIGDDLALVQATGDDAVLDAVQHALYPFGITELVRTAPVTITRCRAAGAATHAA